MEKFCVFCGLPPKDKNKEHVLPRWPLQMTGDPKRIGNFGVRQFSFDSLTFPACSQCNEEFSHLEASAEQVVRKLLAIEGLSTSDFIVLLDWLDKVRVGLWLGYFYLDKNFARIDPKFHIADRVGQSDRMLGLIRVDHSAPRLIFNGTESKFFQLSPTCLGLGM